jgi:PAS domain S-box-containing protein
MREAIVTAIKKSGKSFSAQITSAVFIEDGIEKSITTISDMSQSILEQKNIDTEKEKIVNDNIASAITKQKNIDIKKEKIVAHDILEVKVRYDARLTENNEWLKYIGKSSTHVICDWDLFTDEIFMGEGFEKLFGYSFKNNKGSSSDKSNYIHPDDKNSVENALYKAIESNSSYWEHIYRFVRADGSIANVFERANIIRRADGKACRIIGVMQDISRHKQDEFALDTLGVRKNILVEKVKNIIVELIHYSNEQLEINFSEHVSKILEYDYTYLANLFSEAEGMPIQKYIILQKIERVKELIMMDELSLTEIAWKLHYSSVAHLSNQFKKVTGLTPSLFKQQKHNWQPTLQNV